MQPFIKKEETQMNTHGEVQRHGESELKQAVELTKAFNEKISESNAWGPVCWYLFIQISIKVPQSRAWLKS